MVQAVVMVSTAPGRSEPVRDRILEIAAAIEAHVVAGEFDVIVELDGEEVQDVLHAASSEIQRLDGVQDTKTYIQIG
ncbi:MAG: Lrp/AsnC ligand binding domain-containing protein [Halobacteriaceae archaeon]